MSDEARTFFIGVMAGIMGLGLLGSLFSGIMKGCSSDIPQPLFRIEVVIPKEMMK